MKDNFGLKRGNVNLEKHQVYWDINANETITILKSILNDVAIDIQHIGSTAIKNIYAKPIIDIVVGIQNLEDIWIFISNLKEKEIFFKKDNQKGDLLFVIGDFDKDICTHHIHIVIWNGSAWNDYINFRDFLNENVEKAYEYNILKMKLAKTYANNRAAYTEGKKNLIQTLLKEASHWRNNK